MKYFSLLDVCMLPKKMGSCYGNKPRWYFNTATRKCERFTYGGCDGNANNFASEAECKTNCYGKKCIHLFACCFWSCLKTKCLWTTLSSRRIYDDNKYLFWQHLTMMRGYNDIIMHRVLCLKIEETIGINTILTITTA